MDPIRISRTRVVVVSPSSTWYWVYAVQVPGEKYAFTGPGIGWARGIAKQYRQPGQEVIEEWKDGQPSKN